MLEKTEEGPYWDRLLATKVKQHWLKIDFKNWKDEDDDEAEEGQGQDLGKADIILKMPHSGMWCGVCASSGLLVAS